MAAGWTVTTKMTASQGPLQVQAPAGPAQVTADQEQVAEGLGHCRLGAS
jgi:hypothetical protein